MKLFSTVLLLVLIFAANASASIVLMLFTRDRVVVAADSRAHGGSRFYDSVCKIIQIEPRTFFFATGKAMVVDVIKKTESWSSVSVAREAFSDSNTLDGYGFVRFIVTWTEMMRTAYQDRLIKNRKDLLAGLTDYTISQGFFGRWDSSGLRVYLVQLNYAQGSGPIVHSITRQSDTVEDTISASGDPTAIMLANEFFANTTLRSREANAKFRKLFADPKAINYDAYRLQAAIQSAIEWTFEKGDIGGKVDVMTLDKGGTINWVSQKECSTGNEKNDKQK
jgi:hypothetical protein